MRALLLCALLVAAVYAADWLEVDRAAPYETVSLRFALRQRNLDVLESTLLDTSDPASPNYAKWWTTSEILDLVAPDASVSDFVVNFLLQNGAMNVENRRDMIKCEMAVREVESLLRTTMHVYEAGNSQIIRTRDGYTMPSEISEYVDFISGMEEFPQVREDKRRPIKTGVDIPAQGYVIPEHIQSLYKIPSTYPNNAKTSIALVEFEDDTSYSPTDLKNFEQQMAIPEINVDHTVGPFNGSSPDAESSLDVQYGGAIAINSSVWFWTVDGWMYEFATDIQNATEAPLVVSMSWGWPEPLQCQIDPDGCGTESSFNYVDRLNVEFQKIGLSGITLVAASGDQGAPGDGNADCSNTTVPLWTIFPGASPWVLSVGATMLEGLFVEDEAPAANPPICSQVKCATSTKEGVCTYPDALITTGGGFSNVSPRPSYQNTVVSSYLSSGVTLPDNTFFNKSNRGFPDVSALGHNYLIAWNGQFQQVDGTSCSTPVLAGMITLLNSQRLNSGKQPLGFVVPLMYSAYASNSAIFNDITKGDNKCTEYCCAKTGYEATKGWDPVTGLGTPNFDLLSNYVKTLPN